MHLQVNIVRDSTQVSHSTHLVWPNNNNDSNNKNNNFEMGLEYKLKRTHENASSSHY